MEEKWNFETPRNICSSCGETVPPGKDIHSALRFDGMEFGRSDYCDACWENVRREDLHSFWKTRIPEPEEKPRRKVIDTRTLEDLFHRLREEEDPENDGILFLVAMLLMQRRVLKYREMRTEKGKRFLVLGKPRSPKTFAIPDPDLDPDSLDALQEHLQRVLDQE